MTYDINGKYIQANGKPVEGVRFSNAKPSKQIGRGPIPGPSEHAAPAHADLEIPMKYDNWLKLAACPPEPESTAQSSTWRDNSTVDPSQLHLSLHQLDNKLKTCPIGDPTKPDKYGHQLELGPNRGHTLIRLVEKSFQEYVDPFYFGQPLQEYETPPPKMQVDYDTAKKVQVSWH